MQITVQVSADVARALNQQGTPNADSQALLRTIETLGLTLKPMHPDTDDPNLQNYFTVEVQDAATAQRVADQLRQSDAIKAAYVKPPDELP